LHADFTKKNLDRHQSGLFYNDALDSNCVTPTDVSSVFPFIWLLNTMSHYRDLAAVGERQKINFVFGHKQDNYRALHMYFLGCNGPFGNLFKDTMESLPYKFINRPPRSISFQPNTWDCGICWCLFIYDTMLAMHQRAYMVIPSGKDDAVYHFGHYIHSKQFMNQELSSVREKTNVTTPLCKLWRHEMLEMIERLRWCFLSSRHCDITRPNDWGVTTAEHQLLLSNPLFVEHVKPVLDRRNEIDNNPRSRINAVYTKEKQCRLKVLDGNKCPSIHPDPSLLLDYKRFAEWLEDQVVSDGSWGSLVWNENAVSRHRTLLETDEYRTTEEDLATIRREKNRMIHARYWCDLVRADGIWNNVMLASSPSDVKSFKRECKRLYGLGVPHGLIDVLGDGNCLYYCILHFLVEFKSPLALSIGNNYPLVWIRKLIRDGAKLLDDVYWIGLCGETREDQLDFYYNPHFNFMDDELTCAAKNQEYQGDNMAGCLHLRHCLQRTSCSLPDFPSPSSENRIGAVPSSWGWDKASIGPKWKRDIDGGVVYN
jgi:hypothetical protein